MPFFGAILLMGRLNRALRAVTLVTTLFVSRAPTPPAGVRDD
jgi:hypothetical protein